jgi:hypothetical protein
MNPQGQNEHVKELGRKAMLRSKMCLILSAPVLLLLCSPVCAQDPASNDSISKGLDLLVKFFMLAVVIEVAFATIFQWKIYLKYFHDKGYKTPLIVVVSFIFCKTANLNIVGDLLKILFEKSHEINNYIGLFITALLLAGGSSGMNSLFSKLKIRDPDAIQKRADGLQSELEKKKATANITTEGSWKWIPRR